MLKIDFTQQEINDIKSKIKFTDRQERIIEYRRSEWTLVKMADEEHCDISTISRELKKIKKKIYKVI
jgi:hypothetical protein